jgi:hypothetical protein
MSPHDAFSFDLPHPVLTRIGDTATAPTFATIITTHVELNANAALIYSARGDGVHGHITITINTEDYNLRSIAGVAFKVPKAPPSFPAHKDKATDTEITEDNR